MRGAEGLIASISRDREGTHTPVLFKLKEETKTEKIAIPLQRAPQNAVGKANRPLIQSPKEIRIAVMSAIAFQGVWCRAQPENPMLKTYLSTFQRALSAGLRVSLARFIAACAVPLVLLPVATVSAQDPRTSVDLRNLRNLVEWIGGEADLRRNSQDAVDHLTCNPQTERVHSYPYDSSRETMRIRFSCGLRNPTTAFGSWIIERIHPHGWTHWAFAGTFSRATLKGRTFSTSSRVYVLEGNATAGENRCTNEPAAGKKIRITGDPTRRTGPVVVEISDESGRVIARGTFRDNAYILTGIGPASGVNERLHLETGR